MNIELWSTFLFIYGTATAAVLPKKNAGTFSHEQDYEPEINMTTPEMIEYFGYPAEIHHVTTEDGYILGLHRIPYGVKTVEGPRTPVLVMHGMFSSSADWVINFPDQSLGFMLADAGYDVWIGNARGNTYSRNHTTLDPDNDMEFWNFSWDEMGAYDVPAYIDYVLQYTNYEQLYYVGHSMGTTMAFAMLSTKTEYNSKIKGMMALGPVATLNHVKSPIKYLAPIANEINIILKVLGIGEFLPSDGLTSYFAQDCDDVLETLCEDIIYLTCGYDPEELNGTRMDVYMSHTPAGSSTWVVVHYGQEIDVGRFRHCNWGFEENRRKYGQDTPPDYDVKLITAPVALFWGANDLLADPQDVDNLAWTLPNLIGSFQVGGPNWSHIDYVWGIDAGTVVNQPVMAQMPRF